MSTNYKYKMILVDDGDVVGLIHYNDRDVECTISRISATYDDCVKQDVITKLDWIKVVLDTCKYDFYIEYVAIYNI